MFGHKWEPASGTIVESRVEQAAGGTPQQVRVFVVEARQPDGHVIRATLLSPWGVSVELPPGVPVKLEVHGKTGEVRFDFDPHGPAPVTPGVPAAQLTGVRDAMHLAQQLRGEMSSGGLAAALAGLAQGDGAPGIHVESTVQVNGGPVRALGGEEVAGLMRDLMGGGDRKSAMDRIMQLQAEARAAAQPGAAGQPGATGQPGAAAPVGFSSPDGPSTFDPGTPSGPASSAGQASASGPPGAAPATFSSPADLFGSPAGAGSQAGLARAVGFSSPAAPPPAFGSSSGSPAASGASFGSFSAGSYGPDSFGTGPAGGGSFGTFGETKADRIARLAYQRDHGQLTDEQFQAQSQQIMDEF